MKIAVLFDGPSALGKGAGPRHPRHGRGGGEARSCRTAITVVRVPVNPDGRWVERVRRGKFDLIFNLCEGVDGVAELEPAVISAVEVIGLPYTGSSSWTTSLCLRKHVVNTRARPRRAADPALRRRPSGRPDAARRLSRDRASQRPRMRRSAWSSARSCATRAQLAERVIAMHEAWDEILVQRYVDGREVNVGILGDAGAARRRDQVRRHAARACGASSLQEQVGDRLRRGPGLRAASAPRRCRRSMTAELKRIALTAWRVVGGEGYGRVDLRIDRAGKPWILEVNANPDIAPTPGSRAWRAWRASSTPI